MKARGFQPQNCRLEIQQIRFIGTVENGDRLSDWDIISLVSALIVAGADTVTDLHTLAINALLSHPDQHKLLNEQPQLMEQERSMENDLDLTTAKQRDLADQGMAIEAERNHAKAEAEILDSQISLFEDEHAKLTNALSEHSIPIEAYAIILTRSETLTQSIRQHIVARDSTKAAFQGGSLEFCTVPPAGSVTFGSSS